ncbi:hypothetical protein QE152_g18982 [Popillia japonica]|uniref:Uncharacterized protein n=1 Tax=Popillia japonica TaxID=7064 RepID=A0AAW1KZ37_POPJA
MHKTIKTKAIALLRKKSAKDKAKDKDKDKDKPKELVVRKYRGSETTLVRTQQQTRNINQASVYETSSHESVKSMSRFVCFAKDKGMYTPDNLHDSVLKLHRYCLTHLLDSYRVHLNRLKGIKVLNELIGKAYFDDLKISQIVRIIWCSISIVHHFHIRLKVGTGFITWNRRRQAEQANNAFNRLMLFLLPDLFTTVIHAVVTFFEEARLWDTELLCSDLIQRILTVCGEHIRCLNLLLDVVESSSPANARKVMRVIYDLVRDYKWVTMDEELMYRFLNMYRLVRDYKWVTMDEELMYRFLNMYRDSILPTEASDFSYLKKGLEVCVRRLLKNMNNSDLLKVIENMLQWTLYSEINDEALLDFGNVLEYASMLHRCGLYRFSLTESIFSNILLLIASENLLNSLLGHRVLQHMMDRRGNRQQFDTPRIFFQNTPFNITMAPFELDDKMLIKSYRETIHSNLLSSIQKHGKHRINLESTYTTMAMIVVEVPCGYTAASMVCLAMAIQEDAISNDNLDLECSNRIHAAVMSIMSLVCWTHDAEVFYEYLNTILQRRAEFSPHLNPPIQTIYQYARHHILWNKPELFFEDWEVRYGLWKCFRSKKLTTDLAWNKPELFFEDWEVRYGLWKCFRSKKLTTDLAEQSTEAAGTSQLTLSQHVEYEEVSLASSDDAKDHVELSTDTSIRHKGKTSKKKSKKDLDVGKVPSASKKVSELTFKELNFVVS